MNSPERLTLIRHGETLYNHLKKEKKTLPLYHAFGNAYKKAWDSEETLRLALELQGEFDQEMANDNSPLYGTGEEIKRMSANLKRIIRLPDVIYVSPYIRTRKTLEIMNEAWPELSDVDLIEDDRIREQEQGVGLYYFDRRVFTVLNPSERQRREKLGPLHYAYPQGASIFDVKNRAGIWMEDVGQTHNGQDVLAITHNVTILSFRVLLENLGETELDKLSDQRTINAGVTIYDKGNHGGLILKEFNKKLY